jgi:hypothetical protein
VKPILPEGSAFIVIVLPGSDLVSSLHELFRKRRTTIQQLTDLFIKSKVVKNIKYELKVRNYMFISSR